MSIFLLAINVVEGVLRLIKNQYSYLHYEPRNILVQLLKFILNMKIYNKLTNLLICVYLNNPHNILCISSNSSYSSRIL